MEDKRSLALIALNQKLIDIEYSNSNYKKRTISLILHMIKERRIKELSSLIYLKISGLNVKNNETTETSKELNEFDDRFVVYTCIIGNYDKPVEPLYINEKCKYVLISDSNIVDKGSVWEWLDITKYDIPVKKPNEVNRYVKLHPDITPSRYLPADPVSPGEGER